VACSSDGLLVASAGSDGTVKVWNARTGKCQHVYRHTSLVRSTAVLGVAFAPGSTRRLVSCSDDGTTQVWEIGSSELPVSLDHGKRAVHAVVFSPDGLRVASACHNGSVAVWDAQTGECLWSQHGHQGAVNAVAFSPDGRLIASASDDGKAAVWQASSGKSVATLRGHDKAVHGLAFSPPAVNLLASASADGTVRLWNLTSFTETTVLRGDSAVHAVAFSPDGQRLAWGAGSVKIWETKRWREVLALRGHPNSIRGLAWCAAKDAPLFSASADGTVRVWEAREVQP
jgi:WD40 repeat protein